MSEKKTLHLSKTTRGEIQGILSSKVHHRVRLLHRTSSRVIGAPRLVRGEVFDEDVFVPFTTGADGRVGEAVAAAGARAADRRDTDVLVGGVFISVSRMVAGLGGILYCVGVKPKHSSIKRN